MLLFIIINDVINNLVLYGTKLFKLLSSKPSVKPKIVVSPKPLVKPKMVVSSKPIYQSKYYWLTLIFIGLVMGALPVLLTPIKTGSSNEYDHCSFSDWSYHSTGACFVSANGEPFVGDYVKYVLKEDGFCDKYERKRQCQVD